MRLFGFVLLIAGFLLCISIVWAALGFLMMGFGLICLLVAERNRKHAPKSDFSAFAATPDIDVVAGLDRAVARQLLPVFLEPTFAAAPPAADIAAQIGAVDLPALEDDWRPPAESAPAPPWMENVGDRRAPPPLPAYSGSAAAGEPPPITIAPPIIAEAKPAAKEARPQITRAESTKPERAALFDDTDDLADLFNKFDLGKD